GWKDSSTVSRFKKRHISPTSRVRKRKKKKLAPLSIEPVKLIIDTPTPSSKTTLELGPNDCKWPIGDPELPGFVHCGHKRRGDGPYCENHHARAHPQGVYVSKAGRKYMNGAQA
ncbi:MAG: hypothetical protein GY938_11065, partial [Ketobacter sp.]|nr:hypothetical protein [Ketobacter sp.]